MSDIKLKCWCVKFKKEDTLLIEAYTLVAENNGFSFYNQGLIFFFHSDCVESIELINE